MDFICGKCNTKMIKTADLLVKGCSNCGSKVFKTQSASASKALEAIRSIPGLQKVDTEANFGIMPEIQKEEIQRREDLSEDHIPAIKLKEKGVYEVNIDGLFRNEKNDPVILSGKSGVYRVEFPGSKKKVSESSEKN